ncbi:MAG: DUF4377 domain-containing protein [Bacteroidota bacterium]
MRFLVFVCLLLTGCDSAPQPNQTLPQLEAGEKLVYVADRTATCVGVGEQQCLLVRENPDDQWTYWYDGIFGFSHKTGTSYLLHILEEDIENPPQDASSISWTLIEVVKTWPIALTAGDHSG